MRQSGRNKRYEKSGLAGYVDTPGLTKAETNTMISTIKKMNGHFGEQLFIQHIPKALVMNPTTTEVQAWADYVKKVCYGDIELARIHKGKVSFIFDGWDNDPREICRIPEIRAFTEIMLNTIPVLFLSEPTLGVWNVVSCSLLKITNSIQRKDGTSQLEYEPNSIPANHKAMFNSFFARQNQQEQQLIDMGLTSDEITERSKFVTKQIVDCCTGKPTWIEKL